MDFDLLYAIQSMRNPFLDSITVFVTNITGSYGQLWLFIGICLCIFKKTRKCGITITCSYLDMLIIGQLILKDLIARPRPCHIDQSIDLLVDRPSSYSCPSTHSGWAFSAATSVTFYFRKFGIALLVLAAIISFSRMYLFVHFPTDVLLGIVMGIVSSLLIKNLVEKLYSKNKII